jgi:hypothetical protein
MSRNRPLVTVAWRFVNLIGNYEFYKNGKTIDIQSLIEKLITEFEIDFSTETQ